MIGEGIGVGKRVSEGKVTLVGVVVGLGVRDTVGVFVGTLVGDCGSADGKNVDDFTTLIPGEVTEGVVVTIDEENFGGGTLAGKVLFNLPEFKQPTSSQESKKQIIMICFFM